MHTQYNDDYSTCKETSAVVRIIHEDLNPAWLSAYLQLTPTAAWSKGDPAEWRGRPARTGMWILDTEGIILSRDLRRHLDWLIEQLGERHDLLASLRQQGYQLDVFCHWIQLGGTGGPVISVQNMRGLASLGLDIGFEFWSAHDDEGDA